MTDTAQLPERFTPVRAGLLNLFEYGEQVFEFADGHLLLRGHNGAGKSKALELLLPFVLDGDTHPTKLDPFGGAGREMKWNLTLGGRYESRWGYAWLEFGRQRAGEEPEWVTLAVGVRAHHQTPGATTWFLVIRDRRIGHDLSLINAQSQTPVLRRGIREALGDDIEVFDEAYAYRERINKLLFGFPTVERYETMLELQRQLRRPHLSRGLDAEKLSDILTRALPEVDHRLIADIGAHLDAIEQLRQDLRALTGVRDGFRTFVDTYQAYARAVVAQRANEVLAAEREARAARGELSGKRQASQTAKRAAERLQGEAATLDGQLETKRGAEQELLRSDGVRSANELTDLRAEVKALDADVERLAADIKTARDEAADERAERDKLQSQQRAAVERADAVDGAMRNLAVSAGLEHHEVLSEQLRSSEQPETAAKTMRDAVGERRRDIARQRDLRTAADRASQEAVVRDEAADRAERHVRTTEDRLAACEDELAAHREALGDATHSWAEQLSALVLSDEQTEQLLDTANAAGDPAVSLRAALNEPVHAHEAAWVRTEMGLQADKRRLDEERVPLEAELDELDATRTPEPPTVYTRQANRSGRDGEPLWRLVDFRDDVPDEHQAGLEAALEAIGLLDAWVLPNGVLLDVADDVALTASLPAAGRQLGELLRAVDDGVPTEVTNGILAAIGLGDTALPTLGVRVNVDGSFRAGPASGRYSKRAAQYIGAAARERNRARRLAELGELLTALDAQESELDAALSALADKRATLQTELKRLPDESGVRSAFGAVRDIERDLTRLRPDAEQARADADEAGTKAAGARRAAVEHAREYRLPAPEEQPSLEGLESELSEYASHVGDLVLHASIAAQRATQAGAAETRASRAETRAEGLDEERARRDTLLQRRRGALQALEETEGPGARDALARLEAVQAEIESLATELKATSVAKEEAAVQHATLEANIEAIEDTVREREQELGGKLVRFRSLEEHDFVRLAVDKVAPAPGAVQSWEANQVLQFTRANGDALRPVDTVENLTNAVESGFTRLLAELDGSVGVQPFRQRHDGLDIVAATRAGRQVSVRVLVSSLDEEIAAQQRNLTEQDQKTFERFLFNGIAQELRTRIKAAQLLVEDTNDAIVRCQTSSGMSVELSWEATADGDPLLRRALQLLRSAPEALSASERDQLTRFFRERVEASRLTQDEGTATQHLLDALDYRQWHRFRVLQTKDGIKVQLTKKQHDAGSGGEKAAALHLPLFAAAAAQMRSAGPQAPRLVMLDEAFAGIDNNMRPQLLGLMETFDLDFMLTSHELWCCERELEHLSIYQLHREEGVPGVGTAHFVWNGATGALSEVAGDMAVLA